MTAAVLAAPLTSAVTAVAHGSTALWYLTRATGLVALVLLTATVVLGVIASVGWTAERWPRFLSQTLHRNLSLLCIVLVGVHVVTTVGDGYVPITLLDAVVPFRSPYRPLWVGLGAVAFDLLLAVLVTSALRHRIGYQSWRFVHWLAYLCWPIALFHALGSGTDTPLPAVLALEALCGAAVLASLVWRFTTGRIFTPGQRTAALLGATAVTVAAVAFAALGPLRPDWSHRSGTSSALLSQLTPHAGTTAPSSGAATGTGVPAVPFDVAVSGTESETGPDAAGNVQVVLTLALQDAAATPLTVTLTGTAAGEGLALSSGTVTIGGTPGTVTGLDGGSITASIGQADPYQLTLQLTIDQSTGTVSGTAVGSPAPVTGSSGVEGS